MDIIIWVLPLLVHFVLLNLQHGLIISILCMDHLWFLHKDHHKKDHKSWFERNDSFFIIYALLSFMFVYLWGEKGVLFRSSYSYRNRLIWSCILYCS